LAKSILGEDGIFQTFPGIIDATDEAIDAFFLFKGHAFTLINEFKLTYRINNVR
jgi:hypothetical protein